MKNLMILFIGVIFMSACTSNPKTRAEKIVSGIPTNQQELVNNMLGTCAGFALAVEKRKKGSYQIVFDDCLSQSKAMVKKYL
jgi:hypothetical protein